jgi:NAD(P)-dependent dehydrogenase (short-subunit alcohol dehydrogenase family)
MLKKGRGSIINIGSLYASVSPDARFYDHIVSDPPFLKPPAYGASKAAVVNLARHLASELGNYRINVNAICPGVVESAMTAPMLAREEWRRMLVRQTPAGRWGRTEDVAKLVAFLLSDDAGYINGEDIMIDGGSTLQGAPRWYSLDYTETNVCDWSTPLEKYPYAP